MATKTKPAHTVTRAWNKPKCNACREPIAEPNDALAAWIDDKEHRAHTPMLLHVGDCWKRFAQRARESKQMDMSLHVDALRRSPMEAIIVAMRRRADSEAERLVWHSWISVVLGLPLGDERSLWPGGNAADTMLDHVFTIEEARSITGEGAK